MAQDRVAVVDIGSGSMKVSVFAYVDGKIKSVVGVSRGFRLCSSMGENISERKMAVTIDFLGMALSLARIHGAREIIAVATQAARQAPNFADLRTKVANKTGVELRAIGGEEEAALIADGVYADTGWGKFISFDLGCGSVDMAGFDGHLRWTKSLPLSSINLSSMGSLEAAKVSIDRTISTLRIDGDFRRQCPLVGSGGTVRTANLLIGGQVYRAIGRNALEALFVRLGTMSAAGRIAAGVPKIRADVFPFGLLIILRLMDRLGAEVLFPASVSLREGLARDFFCRCDVRR